MGQRLGRAGVVAAVLAAGAGAAFALLSLSPRTESGQAVATVGDDYYAGGATEPRAGGGPPSECR
jgi:hypothetical protein